MKTNAHRLASSIVLPFALLAGCAWGGNGSGAAPAPVATTSAASSWLQQNAQAFSSTDPANDDFSDLEKFGDAIGDARIVSLGEQSHGAGTEFDLKTRLVKYLHQKKGFDVLMLESGLFDVHRVWQLAQTGQSVDDLAPGVIFFMYSKSAAGRKVLQYVDSQRTSAKPLILTGMDSNHTGNRSRDDLLPMLETFLVGRASTIPASADWPAYKHLVLQAIAFNRTVPPQANLNAFYAVSARLESESCAVHENTSVFPSSPGFWCRVVKSLHNQADRLWGGARNRDIDMAANARWLIDNTFAGHKVIIWAHTVHAGRYGSGDSASMGQELSQHYGKQMYVASHTASLGRYLNFNDKTLLAVAPDLPGSAEDALHQMNRPQLFVDARKNPPPSSLSSIAGKEFDYHYGPPFRLGQAYDGLFYSETIQPATMNR
jgi:erythromycin esterase